jgi:dihydrolipoamide dehydrogenase
MMNEYDVIVIGAGIAGITAAKKCGLAGMRVALVERNLIGGRSLHGGGTFIHYVFQSLKTLVQLRNLNDSNIVGDSSNFYVDFPNLINGYQTKKKTIEKEFLSDLSDDQITFIKGNAKLLSNTSVQIDDDVYYAKHIVLANGGKLNLPYYPGLEQAVKSGFAIEPTEIEKRPFLPKEVVIIGGGRISYELAYIFVVLGTRVTVISNHIVLRTFDDDVRDAITKRIKSPLINIVTDYDFLEFSKDEVIYKSLGETYKLKPDYVVIATGYGVNQEVLGDVVLAHNEQGIVTDDYMRTSIENIYAVGDINDKPKLSNLAIEEGKVAADNIIGIPIQMNYSSYINALMGVLDYTFIGLSENEVIKSKEPYYVAKFSLLKESRLYSKLDTPLIKIIMSKIRDEILGLHIVGQDAVEEITELNNLLEPEDKNAALMIPVYSKLYEINDKVNHIKRDYHKILIEHMYSAYQNLYSNKTNEVVGFESLSRFIIEGNVYPPLPIIEMLERSGYIRDLDYKSFDNALTTLKKLKYQELNISINIASHTLLNTPANYFIEKIKAEGLNPGNITFEITERQMINHSKILEAIVILKNNGFKISLDDFSVGHSSLVLLDKFPFDEVKLDRDLLPRDENDVNAITTYKYLVDLIKQYNVLIVSEGIETSFQYNFIKSLNVDYLQGYYLSKPEKI